MKILAPLDNWWETQSRNHRLDRNPSNICVLLGLMLSSLSIILRGPSPNSVLISMNDDLQVAMCVCIFGGLSIKFYGALCGSRWIRPNMPLRRCYQKGYQGAPVASAGLFVYGWFLEINSDNWTSALGAVLTPMLGLGILLQGFLYALEARRIERAERAMTSIALQVKKIEDL